VENRSTETRYLLLIRLPREAEVAIEDRFLGLAGVTKPAMGYHITLAGPFFVDEAERAGPLQDGLEQLARALRPFRVEVAGLDAFSGEGHTAYLGVAPSRALDELWSTLRRYLESQIDCQYDHYQAGDAFRPHVTLGIGLSDDELRGITVAHSDAPLALSFLISEVWLALQEPNGPWEFLSAIPLGRQADEN